MKKHLHRRSKSRKWNVEFSWRFSDEHQRRVIGDLGMLADQVLRLYLEIRLPSAAVREQRGKVENVAFRTRSAARLFANKFGGTLSIRT